MDLLMVDDEISMLNALERNLSWEELPFLRHFRAGNIQEAKEVLQNSEIGVILCDIEMPFGSGLELLEWAHENRPEFCCVLMTCHSEFSFAQRALRVGCFDYILKPVNFSALSDVLRRASQEASARRDRLLAEGDWHTGRRALAQHFWTGLLDGSILPQQESISRCLERMHLSFPMNRPYVPILLITRNLNAPELREDAALLQYGLRNITEELMALPDCYRGVVPCGETGTAVIFLPFRTEALQITEIEERCLRIAGAAEELGLKVICYLGRPTPLEGLPQELEHMKSLDTENVLLDRVIVQAGGTNPPHRLRSYEDKSFEEWEKLLKEGFAGQVCKEILDCIARRERERDIDRSYLEAFHRDIIRLVYTSGADHSDRSFSEVLFDTEEAGEATRSVHGMQEWVGSVMALLQEKLDRENAETAVEQVKHYVIRNIANELSLQEVADWVHLNPSYLSRIFKKKTGLPLNRYIAQEKIKVVKWHLSHTDESIGDIAARVGYFNYSSFHRNFTRLEGISPQEYKQRMKRL